MPEKSYIYSSPARDKQLLKFNEAKYILKSLLNGSADVPSEVDKFVYDSSCFCILFNA